MRQLNALIIVWLLAVTARHAHCSDYLDLLNGGSVCSASQFENDLDGSACQLLKNGDQDFQINVDQQGWTANVPLSFTISTASDSGLGINGFIFAAFDSDHNRIGSWSYLHRDHHNRAIGEIDYLNCSNPDGSIGQTISHTTTTVASLNKHQRGVSSITLSLTLPTPDIGSVTFSGIVISSTCPFYKLSMTIPEFSIRTPISPYAPIQIKRRNTPLSTMMSSNNNNINNNNRRTLAANGCLNGCSGKGVCTSAGTCLCDRDWLSADCSIAAQAPISWQSNGAFGFQYKVANNYLHMRMIAPTKGYIAIMLECDADGMTHGIDWVALVPPGSASDVISIQEEKSTGQVQPFITSLANGPHSLFDKNSIAGRVNSTHFEALFSRLLSDPTPSASSLASIPANGTVTASWATGPRMVYEMHTSAGKMTISMETGQVTGIDPVSYTLFAYTPPLVFLAVILIMGILLRFDRIRKDSVLGRLLVLWRPSATISTSTAVDKFTLDARQTFQDMVISEHLVALLWIGMNIAIMVLGYREYRRAGVNVSYVWSHILAINFAATLLPIARNSIASQFFGSSFERVLKLHRWLGRITFVALYLHSMFMTALYGANRWSENVLLPHGHSVIAGTLSFICINIIVITAVERIRRAVFEFFYYVHICFFLLATLFAMIHSWHFRYYCMVPLALYGLDRLIRLIRSFRRVQLLDYRVHTSPDLSTVTELTVKIPGMRYQPGSYVFVSVPLISLFEWHPISISSCDREDGTITLHIQDVDIGTWSNNLSQYGRRIEAGVLPMDRIWISIDGPHGGLSLNPYKYPILVLAGGGIGITPIMSIALEIDRRSKMKTASQELGCIQAVHFIWTTKQSHHIEEWFSSALNSLLSNKLFHVHLYATSKISADIDHKKSNNGIHFHPYSASPTPQNQKRIVLSLPPSPSPSPVTPTNANNTLIISPKNSAHLQVPNNNNNNNSSVEMEVINSSPKSTRNEEHKEEDHPQDDVDTLDAGAEEESVVYWREYEDEYDEYADFDEEREHTKRKYWHNVRTGQTSYVPPHVLAQINSTNVNITSNHSDHENRTDDERQIRQMHERSKSWFASLTPDAFRGHRVSTSAAPPSPTAARGGGGDRDGRHHRQRSRQGSLSRVSRWNPRERALIDKINHGRPDISRVFNQIVESHSEIINSNNLNWSDSNVAVFVCGPKAFMNRVHNAAGERDWHLHKETFGF